MLPVSSTVWKKVTRSQTRETTNELTIIVFIESFGRVHNFELRSFERLNRGRHYVSAGKRTRVERATVLGPGNLKAIFQNIISTTK